MKILSSLFLISQPGVHKSVDEIIIHFKKRGKRYRKIAMWFLFTIIVTIVIGLFVFANASRFSVEFQNATPNEKSGTAYFQFFDSLSTKVGSVILLLFLVQMLIKVFRYNLRLSAYYLARADALELSQVGYKKEFDSLITQLSPDNIDVGYTVAPTEHILELLKNTPRGQ